MQKIKSFTIRQLVRLTNFLLGESIAARDRRLITEMGASFSEGFEKGLESAESGNSMTAEEMANMLACSHVIYRKSLLWSGDDAND